MNCPNCGKELAPGDKFCMGCGAKIESAGNGTNSGATPSLDAVNAFAGNAFNGAKNTVMGTSPSGVNFMVRRFFFGFGDFIRISIIVWVVCQVLKTMFGGYSYYGGTNGFGSFCGVLQVIAVIVFIAAIAMDIYFRVVGMGKANVDEATQNGIATFKARAQERFNVEAEQVSEVEPIVVAGPGNSPVELLAGIPVKRRWFVGLGKFYSKDPVEAYRIGLDRVPRYLLLQTTVYAFTDTQLLTYTGNMDISTGVIYDEQVSETFYKDVNSVTQRDVLKKYKAGFFRKEYYITKYFNLDVCGISKLAAFDSRFASTGATNAATSLNGMESYIREKKF